MSGNINIKQFKTNRIVKNKKRSVDTTITIKVSSELRLKWNKYCMDHNINQRATLENFLIEIIKD